MNILVDIGHPAHVHMFRCFAHEMEARGHKVLFTSRDKEFEIQLLQKEGFDFVNIGKKHTSVVGKCWDLLRFGWKVWRIARRFKADFFLSHGSLTAAHVAHLMRKPNIAFEDTYNMEQIRLWEPFTDVICTAQYPHPLTHHKKNLSYAGYNELLYLHPNQFTSNEKVIEQLGLTKEDKFVIIRFVAWQATHDSGHKGMALENKIAAVREFSKYAKVFISSEKPLPQELEQYCAPWTPDCIHDVLAYASLVFGESSTMAEEATMLGVPAIYLTEHGTIYTNHLEKEYGLCQNFGESDADQQAAIARAVEILKTDKKEQHQKNQAILQRLLDEHIDVTAFLVWFVENYPTSHQEMLKNPNIQYNFK